MEQSKKVQLAISIGDLNGIGLEVILKTFSDKRMFSFCLPVIFCSSDLVHKELENLGNQIDVAKVNSLKKLVPNKLNIYEVWTEKVQTNPGEKMPELGKYAFLSLEGATQAVIDGQLDALVTAPIDKSTIQSAEFNGVGHTQYLEKKLKEKALMMMVSGQLKVGLLSDHVPLSDVSKLITEEALTKRIKQLKKTCIEDFGHTKPTIGVLALNPHAGDSGLIGSEEAKIMEPVIEKFKNQKDLVYGPYPADAFFGTHAYRKFDAILAMYHDQGLIPFKSIAFEEGVNFTAGLSCIRTSPDHGTAYDIAGSGKADPNSFRQAIFLAIDLYKQRVKNAKLDVKIKA